ncbi:MAG: hypothetical protein N4J56_006676 [Chroococcidiopsis sp. SAG 2025]|uniref:hypothetical protein n=1 Tax=Chroococcidiopsis sp. SAG 2025 TaxID=171389 RepID=UPI002936D9A7|nr:hypothetical protein [Chroococcidiopsis sp. SAG 2025]MDV2996971.1 hypothetical protein [Chroococcidiopsis sp. SAG 2025]
MPFSDWCILVPQEKNQTDTQHSQQSLSPTIYRKAGERKVIPFKANDPSQSNSDTCVSALQVNEIHTQQEAEVPLQGTSALPANKAVNEIDLSNSATGSLSEKLAAARLRGWRDTGTWWNDLGEQMVTVNRFVVRATEFMQRSLGSFDVGRQVCESGLRMCREQIEKIKQKKHQQLCDRVIAIARVGNSLEQEFCYG